VTLDPSSATAWLQRVVLVLEARVAQTTAYVLSCR